MASSKPPLIFIHGFRGNHLGLEAIADYFTDYQVFIPDLPPAGKQQLPTYTAHSYANWMADYIKGYHIKKPILIGHSMGSIIAAATATHYPDLVGDKLILLSPISVKTPRLFAALTPLSTLLPNKIISYFTTKYLIGQKGKKKFRNILGTTYVCGADFTTKKEVYQTAKFSVSHAIKDFKLRQRTLFIIGEQDRVVSKKKSVQTANQLGAEITILKNTGHLHNYEAPKSTATAIREFLEKA